MNDKKKQGLLTLEEGAETVTYLALSTDPNVEKGRFWYKKKAFDFDDEALRVFTY